jgi:hypothetical protein
MGAGERPVALKSAISGWGGVTTAIGLSTVLVALALDLFPPLGVAAGVGLLSFAPLMMMFGAVEARLIESRDRRDRR